MPVRILVPVSLELHSKCNTSVVVVTAIIYTSLGERTHTDGFGKALKNELIVNVQCYVKCGVDLFWRLLVR